MLVNSEETGGLLGNFERRRQIEEQVAESRPVGRTRPRQRETTPGAALWNPMFTQERLVDERG
jgi:hypothetical protein